MLFWENNLLNVDIIITYLSVAALSWSESLRASHKATRARNAGGSTFTTDGDGAVGQPNK